MGESSGVALAVLAIFALGASLSRAETVTVPPCGSTPGTTAGAYSGLVNVTVSGSLVITPGNPDQDAFHNFNESNPSTAVSPNPDTFRYNRVSEGTCLCGFECPSTSHRVSDILVGPYPAYDPSHTYTVELDLGTAIAVPLHFGIYDCGCGDNSGELTVTIDSGSTVTTTTVPPPPPTTTTTLPLFCPPGTRSQREPLQQDQPAWLTQELTLDSVRDGTILAAKKRQTVAQRKVESHLSRLAWPNAALGGPRSARRRFGLQALRMSDPQSVYVRLKSMSARRVDRVASAGLKIEVVNEKSSLIQGTCASSVLPAIAALPFVTAIRPVDRAFTRVGHAETEGDAASRATLVRSVGYDGSGTSVGVLSDGIDHLADSQATGDLAPVTVPSDSRCHQGSGDEGTALLEIVHDLAPGAQLFFSGPTTSLEFIDSVNCLTAAGAKIIVDDIGFLNEPFFEDGPVASAVRAAVQGGVSYHSAAGNDAMDYLEQAFRATPGSDFHDFLGGPIDNADDVLVPAFGSLLCVLQWNDPFGESGNDYDLFLLDENLNVIDESVGLQTGTQDPIEAVMATNPTGLTQRALVAIKKYAGDARTLKLVCKGGLAEQYVTPGGSIFGHPAVQEVVTVGAIDVADQCLDDVERFSSEGPVDIAFPSPTERAKPDLAGFDGVSISNAGRFPPGCPPNCRFFGTSAAAPHSAAVAALVLSKNPFLAPADIQSVLKSAAADIGLPGPDNLSGAGRLDALAAANAVPVPECFVDGQCNDGTACTVDRCTRGRCAFTPLPGVQYVSCRLDELRAVVDRASSNDVTARVRRKLDKLLRQAASALRKASQAEVTRRLRPERVDLRATSKTLQHFRRAVDAGARRGRISQAVAASVQQHLGVAGEALGSLLASITQ